MMRAGVAKGILFCLCLIGMVSAWGAECVKTGWKCNDAAASKTISGVVVPNEGYAAYGCWDWEFTYDCVEPNAVDYCAGIASTPGCAQTGGSCTSQAFNSECLIQTNTYRCGNSITPAVGVVKLEDTHTIVFDNYDYAPCADQSGNPSCQLAKTTCVDGPSTKNINGLDVTRCWKEQRDYSCVVDTSVNYCAALDANGCQVQSSVCTKTAYTGACMERDYTYVCEEKPGTVPSNIMYLNTTYTIIKDTTDTSQCQNMDTNPNCTLAAHICVEGAETRNINGLDVYKDCWKWQDDYTCSGFVQTSTCDPLKNDPNCTEVKATCVQSLPNGQCGHTEHQYRCVTGEATTKTQVDCSDQSFCVDGTCFDSGYASDTDFAMAVVAQEIGREAGDYGIFQGKVHRCTKTAVNSCCETSPGGETSRNDAVAMQVGVTVLKAGFETVKVFGSKYVYDALMDTGSSFLQNVAKGALGQDSWSSTGNFSIWGAKFSFTSGEFAVTFDPWSLGFAVASYIIADLMSCTQDEQTLAISRGQSLCVQAGSYCDTEVMGTCTVKGESWCCFPSKLARIIQEQGRAQIGKSWGSGETPDCSGFTVTELNSLNFEAMDFSEFIADIVASAKGTGFATQRLQQKATGYYGGP